MKITLGSSRWTVTLNTPMELMMALKSFRSLHVRRREKKGHLLRDRNWRNDCPMLSNTSCKFWEGNLTRTYEQKDRTSQLLCRQDRVKNTRERWQRLTANVKVGTVLGLNPASSDTVESEGRQTKQCWITYIEKNIETGKILCTYKSAYRGLTSSAPNEESSNSGCSQFFSLIKRIVWYSKWAMFIKLIAIPHSTKKRKFLLNT